MNLSQLYYFSKLSELEHFSKAAKELYITQPSLSHAIKSLETELGVQLFEREGRRMRLTPFGKEFAIYVKRGLREIDKGVELAQEFNGKLGGTVNVGAVLTVQGDYLRRCSMIFPRTMARKSNSTCSKVLASHLSRAWKTTSTMWCSPQQGSANRTFAMSMCFPMNW